MANILLAMLRRTALLWVLDREHLKTLSRDADVPAVVIVCFRCCHLLLLVLLIIIVVAAIVSAIAVVRCFMFCFSANAK